MTPSTPDHFYKHIAESVAWQQRLISQMTNQLSAARTFESIQTSIRAFEATLRSVLAPAEELQKALKSMASMRAFWQQTDHIREMFDQLPGRLRRALIKIGEAGWYLDPHISLPATWELEKAIDQGSSKNVEEALVEYFDTEIDRIDKLIVQAFPERATIVHKAIEAHRRGDYELSIPVLLAQADGICLAASRIRLFSRKGGRPRTARLVKRSKGPIGSALLSLLEAPLPITASKGDEDFAPDALNRHAVLHGVVTNYASKANSLKALSLLNYVTYVFTRTEP